MELSKILIRAKNLCDLSNLSIDSDKMYDIISKNVSSILEFIKPSEFGLSISAEKSFDIFIKYKNYQIYYNIFFENEIENIWLDIYENKNSICSYDGSSEDVVKILKNKIKI